MRPLSNVCPSEASKRLLLDVTRNINTRNFALYNMLLSHLGNKKLFNDNGLQEMFGFQVANKLKVLFGSLNLHKADIPTNTFILQSLSQH